MPSSSNNNEWIILIAIMFIYLSVTNKFSELVDRCQNQETYLRKISDQLNDLKERFDNTPANERAYNSIQERGEEAEVNAEAFSEQLKLFYTGKVRTGIITLILDCLPVSFLNYEEIRFDGCREAIENYYAIDKYYTTERMKLLKPTLLERSSGIIERWCKSKIESNMPSIIEAEIAEEIIRRNNYELPAKGIYYLVKRYSVWDKIHNKDNGLSKRLLNELVKNGMYSFKQMALEEFMPADNA